MKDPLDTVEGEINSFDRKGIAFMKQAAGAFFTSLIRPIATLTEALMRFDFGERYFTVWNVLAGAVFLLLASFPLITYRASYSSLWFETARDQWQTVDYLTLVVGVTWLLLFLANASRHRKRIRERNQKGILWHSYSCGCSLVPEKSQPFYPIVLGIVLVIFHIYGPGVLMLASGYISLQSRAREASLLYARVLDMIDGQIEQEQLSDAVLKKGNPSATCGFVAPLPAYVSTTHRKEFLKAMGVKPAQTAKAGDAAPVPAEPQPATPSPTNSPSQPKNRNWNF